MANNIGNKFRDIHFIFDHGIRLILYKLEDVKDLCMSIRMH